MVIFSFVGSGCIQRSVLFFYLINGLNSAVRLVWQVPLFSEPSYQPKMFMIFCGGNSPLAIRKSPFNVPYICVNSHSLGGIPRGPLFPVGSVPLMCLYGLA